MKRLSRVNIKAISGDKRIMKFAFKINKIKTPEWGLMSETYSPKEYPVIFKHKNSMAGRGVYYIENEEEFQNWFENHKDKISSYIWEKYYKIVNEFRVLSIDDKIVDIYYKKTRKDVEAANAKIKHNALCVFKTKEHWPLMYEKYKPYIEEILTESIKAAQACNVRISGTDAAIVKNGDDYDIMIFEVNSIPGLGDGSRAKLLQTINMFNIKL